MQAIYPDFGLIGEAMGVVALLAFAPGALSLAPVAGVLGAFAFFLM